MRAHRPAATLATAAIIATSFAACDDTIAYATPCPDQMTFAVGGVDDPGARRVPGLSGPVTRVRYSASIAPVGDVPGDVSRREGERALDRAARSFRRQCPDSRIRIVGQSMGALVAGNVRDRWERDPVMRERTAFTLVSDPRAPRGIMSMIPSVVPGLTMQGPRPQSSIATSSVCRTSDAICDIGNPLQDPGHAINAVWGYANGDHGYAVVDHAPGRHMVPERVRVVPDTPIAWQPPTPRQVLEPIVKTVVPKHLPAPVAREISRLWKQHVR
ncbi:cutinase family protein [Gordonia sp. MMO-8]|uniref:cutinase family protein n=1 Tax=Gordonia sp. MMO-8 TaxID=3127886 RepID=UPI0030186F94